MIGRSAMAIRQQFKFEVMVLRVFMMLYAKIYGPYFLFVPIEVLNSFPINKNGINKGSAKLTLAPIYE